MERHDPDGPCPGCADRAAADGELNAQLRTLDPEVARDLFAGAPYAVPSGAIIALDTLSGPARTRVDLGPHAVPVLRGLAAATARHHQYAWTGLVGQLAHLEAVRRDLGLPVVPPEDTLAREQLHAVLPALLAQWFADGPSQAGCDAAESPPSGKPRGAGCSWRRSSPRRAAEMRPVGRSADRAGAGDLRGEGGLSDGDRRRLMALRASSWRASSRSRHHARHRRGRRGHGRPCPRPRRGRAGRGPVRARREA